MPIRTRTLAPVLLVAAVVVASSVAGVSAIQVGSGTTVTGAQVADESLTGSDVRNGSLDAKELAAAAQQQLKGTYASAATSKPLVLTGRAPDSCYMMPADCWNQAARMVVAKARIDIPYTGRLLGMADVALDIPKLESTTASHTGNCTLTASLAGSAPPTGGFGRGGAFDRYSISADWIDGPGGRPVLDRSNATADLHPSLGVDIAKPGAYDVYLSCSSIRSLSGGEGSAVVSGRFNVWTIAS